MPVHRVVMMQDYTSQACSCQVCAKLSFRLANMQVQFAVYTECCCPLSLRGCYITVVTSINVLPFFLEIDLHDSAKTFYLCIVYSCSYLEKQPNESITSHAY